MKDRNGVRILESKKVENPVNEEIRYHEYPVYEFYVNKRGKKVIRSGAFGKEPKLVYLRIH